MTRGLIKMEKVETPEGEPFRSTVLVPFHYSHMSDLYSTAMNVSWCARMASNPRIRPRMKTREWDCTSSWWPGWTAKYANFPWFYIHAGHGVHQLTSGLVNLYGPMWVLDAEMADWAQ